MGLGFHLVDFFIFGRGRAEGKEFKVNVLLISYHYSPAIVPRAFRWNAIAERWVREGHRVDVICSWKPGYAREEKRNGVTIIRTGGSVSEKLRGRLNSSPNAILGKSQTSATLSPDFKSRAVAARLIRLCHDLTWKKLYWPDFACLWHLSALAEAKKMVGNFHYDAVITVSHPFSSHWAGLKLKRERPEIPWLVDIGDPFFFHTMPANNRLLYDRINYRAEQNVLRHADCIIVNTERTREKYVEGFQVDTSKMHVSPPLVSVTPEAILPVQIGRSGRTRLVFIGTLYSDIRNPASLLAWFEGLHRELEGSVELHFYGNIGDCGKFFEPYDRLNGERLFVHGLVSREEAYNAMTEADILVNIGNKTPELLPSKLVEYASTGKPIFNLISISEDSSVEFFRTYHDVIHAQEEELSIGSETWQKVLHWIRHRPTLNQGLLQQFMNRFTVETIAAQYEDLVVSVEGKRPRIASYRAN
jgi:glycosyltransferase involved in cell wall biosynthesis